MLLLNPRLLFLLHAWSSPAARADGLAYTLMPPAAPALELRAVVVMPERP